MSRMTKTAQMRREALLAAAAFAWALHAGVVMDQSSVEFRQVKGGAEIAYTLGDDPAIVTLEIQTNTLANGAGEWLDIGGWNVQSVFGDVNRIVRETGTQRKIYWKASKDMPERIFKDGTIRAVLTAWATNAPPDYMVVGLRKSNDVRFYASTNYLPEGIGSDRYRTTELLMRKIPAAGVVWKMGTPDNESDKKDDSEKTGGRNDFAYEYQHLVMLTEDYYMGVYEVTQAQYTNMCSKSNGAYFNNQADSPLRPMENIGLEEMRGQTTAFGNGIWWPKTGHQVTDNSAIGQLRTLSGLADFDLPTAAQWEFACRAGTTTAFSWGSSSANTDYCWYSGNYKRETARNGTSYNAPQAVGTKLPNAFGLYDMHGNVEECCLDRNISGDDYKATFAADWEKGGVTVDPDGGGESATTTLIVKAGGSSAEGARQMRSGARWTGGWSYASYFIGFRLWHPARFK